MGAARCRLLLRAAACLAAVGLPDLVAPAAHAFWPPPVLYPPSTPVTTTVTETPIPLTIPPPPPTTPPSTVPPAVTPPQGDPPTVTPVAPEPATLLMGLLGACGVGLYGLWRRKAIR